MKGTSKVIMGATLVMVVTLAVVLGLILVLLAELYCSLLLRRRRHLRNTSSSAIPTANRAIAPPSHTSSFPQPDQPSPSPFSSIYAQGVLRAPRSFLCPAIASNEDMAEPKKQHSELRQFIQIKTQEANASSHHQIGLLLPTSSSSSSPPAACFMSKTSPKPTQEGPSQGATINATVSICASDQSCNGGGGGGEHLVYISNPIYENDESKCSSGAETFETPDTSPSRLEGSGSSGDDNDDVAAQASHSPPLSPMKKLPAEASSVSLRDARSLGTSGSDSQSVNGLSSSSASPSTSPSW